MSERGYEQELESLRGNCRDNDVKRTRMRHLPLLCNDVSLYVVHKSGSRKLSIYPFLLVLSLLIVQFPSQAQVSERSRALLTRSWDEAAFQEWLAIATDQNEDDPSRGLALEVLHSNRLKMRAEEKKQFLQGVTTIAKNRMESRVLSAQAIRVMSSMALTMQELGDISDLEAKQESPFLLNAAQDQQRDIQVRASAIRALGMLRVAEASPVLRSILSDKSNLNRPDIARCTCLALQQVDGRAAVTPIKEILNTTQDASVFGTAAFALGQIKAPESMAALVETDSRFTTSGSCDAVLVDMEDVILTALKNPSDPNLIPAILATRHLWRDGQRERYVPLLRALVTTAPLGARKAALERLIEAAGQLNFEGEKRELAAVLPAIENQPQLDAYAQQIQGRLSATLLNPNSSQTQVPSVRKGAN